MYDDNSHPGHDHTRGNTRGRSCSVSVLCNGESLINVLRLLVEEVLIM